MIFLAAQISAYTIFAAAICGPPPSSARGRAAYAFGIAASLLVPLSGAPALPLPTQIFLPLLLISVCFAVGLRRCVPFMAMSAAVLAAADIAVMSIGIPGARFSIEAAAMIGRLSSISSPWLHTAIWCASLALGASFVRASRASRDCRPASLALAAFISVVLIPADSSSAIGLVPPISSVADLAVCVLAALAIFAAMERARLRIDGSVW